MSRIKIDTRPDGHCYLCGTPITVGRRRTREKAYTASEIREMVEGARPTIAAVDVYSRARIDGWNGALDALLAQLDAGAT